MPISLKNSTSLWPYLRYSPQKDKWFVPDNGAAKAIDIIGKPIAIDVENGTPGWLLIDTGRRDWRPYPITDISDPPPAPGPNYKRGFALFAFAAKALGAPEIFELCSSTSSHNNFAENLYNECEPRFNKGEIPVVKITGSTPIKVGKGSSADIHYTIIKWIARPPAFVEAVALRDSGDKPASKPSVDDDADEFGHDDESEQKTEPAAAKKPRAKRASKPAPDREPNPEPEPTPELKTSDFLDDDSIPF